MKLTRKERIMQAVARGWCTEGNSGKEMDANLAMAITEQVMAMPRLTLDIEQELIELYGNTTNEGMKLDILMRLDDVKLQQVQGKDKGHE